MLRQLIRKMLKVSPYQIIKKNPHKYSVHKEAILLDDTNFYFYVPNHIPCPAVSIGSNSIVGCSFIFESTNGVIKIGERTYVGPGTKLIARSDIEIGNDVCIAWGCYIYDHNSHSLSWRDRKEDIKQVKTDLTMAKNMLMNKNWEKVVTKPVIIQDKVWIGFEAVILKGVTVGEGAVIGARSVVTKNVPPYTIVAGNPARIIRELRNDER